MEKKFKKKKPEAGSLNGWGMGSESVLNSLAVVKK